MANSKKTIIKKLEKFFKSYPDISVAILFGSAARDRLAPGSDIDIAVAAEKCLSFSEKINLANKLSRYLSHNIDLIDLNAVSGTILKQALCTGIVLKKSTEAYAFLLKKMLYNQADMMPYTKMILKKHSLDFING